MTDGPRFGWRGLLIDPARHFLSIALLKRIVDGMVQLRRVCRLGAKSRSDHATAS
ncbi:MAG: family 20 glycosylhydrolase [Rubripirellula sp.]